MNNNLIKSLIKSIDVLKIVQAKNGISLNDLHKKTAIPKPTLCRILATFEHCHIVRKSLIDNLYRSNYALSSPSSSTSRETLIAVASEVLDEVCQRLVWPSDLLIPKGDYMEVAETSRRHSPLSINRDSLGDRVNILYSAVGRAYLAFCTEEERTNILDSLKKSTDPFYQRAKNKEWINRIIEETIENGYGVRDNTFRTFKKDEPALNDGLSAIAVPIIIDKKVVGCINMLWPSRLYTETNFAKQHLSDLQKAAKTISERTIELLG